MRVRGTTTGVLLALLALLALSACSGDGTGADAASTSPTPSIRTLSPLPMPDMGPPDGKVVADLRQSSRDAALNRFEVWIGNGLDRDLRPTRILYLDPRFRAPIPGERLRLDPAGSERGYPLTQPARPACGVDGGRGRVQVTAGGETTTYPVQDEADVVARYVASRCFELASQRVATLSFSDEVTTRQEGDVEVGTLTLLVDPTGGSAGRLSVVSVTGTPVLTAYPRGSWHPRVTVAGGDPVQRIELPTVPARCDGHAFGESGGATAFRVALRLDGQPGELLVRMSPEGARAAIGFAEDACGI
ncbi:hypothetical protein [Nocardioides taihuensis]|uniref:Lipoprotein n=1 Tax=Nocardioides taihuensis TaxID=1835606 RepID=A0ABW0BGF0_9ACTN